MCRRTVTPLPILQVRQRHTPMRQHKVHTRFTTLITQQLRHRLPRQHLRPPLMTPTNHSQHPRRPKHRHTSLLPFRRLRRHHTILTHHKNRYLHRARIVMRAVTLARQTRRTSLISTPLHQFLRLTRLRRSFQQLALRSLHQPLK